MSTRFFKGIKKKLHSIRQNLCFYYTASLSKPILKNTILLEADQGRNVDGSIFRFCDALKDQSKIGILSPWCLSYEKDSKRGKSADDFLWLQ